MLKKVIKYSLRGISWGCTISCFICMIGVWRFGNEWFTEAPRNYIAQVIAAIIVGVGWVVPSMVYQNEKLSRALQVLIHMTIGFVVYFPCAFYMGWISTDGGVISVILEIIMVIVISLLIWMCFSLYYRKEAKDINNKIKELYK